jgi:hypothetical protein
MQRIIIGIHGLGNKPAVPLYKSWWRKSLYEGFSAIGHPRRRLPFELVYWADVLHPQPQDESIVDSKDARYLDEPWLPSPGILVNKSHLMRKALLDLFEKQLKRLKLDDDGNIIWKQISDLVLQRYFTDLDCYYANCLKPAINGMQPVRDRIRDRLAETLRRHRDKEILLIAHSMGSIIAFDVLTHNVPDIPIHTLITIGSPLGVPVVVHKIKKEMGRQQGLPPAPDSITARWCNLADLEDKVALDYTLFNDYAANRHGIAPQDLQVYNDYAKRGRRNPHKDFGYLRTPELAQLCFDFLYDGESPTRIRRLDLFYKVYEAIEWLRTVFDRMRANRR